MKLITGALGQIGVDLAQALRTDFSETAILETDLRLPHDELADGRFFELLDVTDRAQLVSLVEKYQVTEIYHLASLLSATGEKNPDLSWEVNVNGLRNVLAVAKAYGIKVFWPSSIAVFGPATPRFGTPQTTIEDPATMYGITKVTGEMLCRYAADHYGLDVRSLRLPGIISYSAPPGGGTTDYAVEIFHEALAQGHYTSFVRPDTRLPMMYMPDAIRAILDLMRAPKEAIKVRSSYNLAAVSFSMEQLVAEIQRHLPDFTCSYAPDFRQAIADSWPADLDDSQARKDWGWHHAYDLATMVEDMLANLSKQMKLEKSTQA